MPKNEISRGASEEQIKSRNDRKNVNPLSSLIAVEDSPKKLNIPGVKNLKDGNNFTFF